MTERYTRNYRILGIQPEASWKELRHAYKNLIKIWHPDRYQQNVEQRKLAEEKTKEITQSYKELAEYYKKFGVMPKPGKPTKKTVPQDSVVKNYEYAHSEQNEENATESSSSPSHQTSYQSRSRKQRARILAVIALAGIAYFAWQIMPEDRSTTAPESNKLPETVITQKDENSNPRDLTAKKYFTFGASLGEVYAIQGVPTKTESDVWYYGESKIYFSKGKVLRWEESVDNPLQVNIAQETEKNALFFDKDSSKQKVLAIQGTPDRDTENVWDYGASRVYFANDRVKGWDESPLYPLKIRR